jgi:beta-glucosidase
MPRPPPRFGLIAVDRDRDFARYPKPSAHAFARIARSGRLDALHKHKETTR